MLLCEVRWSTDAFCHELDSQVPNDDRDEPELHAREEPTAVHISVVIDAGNDDEGGGGDGLPLLKNEC